MFENNKIKKMIKSAHKGLVTHTARNQAKEVEPQQGIDSYWLHEQGVTCRPQTMPRFP